MISRWKKNLMSKCQKCHVELAADAKFCMECGTPVSAVIEDQAPSAASQPEASMDQTRVHAGGYAVVSLSDLPPGYLVDDRYDIQRKLGQGGFCAVYLAHDRKMGVDKALKVIPEMVANDVASMANLRDEARTMLSLNHPHIVRVYDLHDSGAIRYIDMEYVEGKTLAEILVQQPGRILPEEEVKELAV